MSHSLNRVNDVLLYDYLCVVFLSNVLAGERQEDVFLCAGPTGHVLLLVVEPVVAGLGAADHLGQRVALMVGKTKKKLYAW